MISKWSLSDKKKICISNKDNEEKRIGRIIDIEVEKGCKTRGCGQMGTSYDWASSKE